MFANKFGEHSNVCCGLVKLIKIGEWQKPIPLISVDVNAEVIHAVAQVEVTQVYENKEEQPIEAVYYFPVNPDGAVTHFRAEVEGRVIKGTVKPQEEAKEDYDKAVNEKKTAFLGEEAKADIFKIRVGFLKPGVKAKVIIEYVTEVKNEPGSNAIRFYIPTTIAPRYISAAEKAMTRHRAKNISQFSETSPAPLSLKVAVSLQGGIKSIQSPTHKVKVEKLGPTPENEIWHKAIVELEGMTAEMDRDFVLNIEPEEVHKPRIYSEKTESGSTAMMVHFKPSFQLDEQKTELIFVLDRSGSMQGRSIELAKKALVLFLHSMPADCYFNVIGFGSTFKFLFPKSAKYSNGTLMKATAHAKSLNANLGGTEILEPLKKIYDTPEVDGYLRQIFILTDGEVSNTDGVLGIAQANAHKARVFALGIGDAASHHLVEGVAKAGGGTSAFVTYNESIDRKVLNQLKNGLQPSLTDIELEWKSEVNKEKTLIGYGKPKFDLAVGTGPKNKQSPKRIPPVYDGSQLLVFGLFQDECPKSVLIKAQSPDGPLTLNVEYSSANDGGHKGMLHRLAAIKLIRELKLYISALRFQGQGLEDEIKEEEKLKKEIVEISCRNGITSRYTSFIAVDESDKVSEEHWVMETRNVPSQVPYGWHGIPSISRQRDGVEKSSPIRTTECGGGGRRYKQAGESRGRVRHEILAPKRMRRMYRVEDGEIHEEHCGGGGGPVEFVGDSDESSDGGSSDIDPVPETVTPLLALASLQASNGSYKLNKKLADVFGISLRELLRGVHQVHFRLTKKVFATALAVSFFETKLADEKDVWELMAVKAKKWMAKAVEGDPDVVDAIIEKASAFLGF